MFNPTLRKTRYVSEKESYANNLETQYYAIVAAAPDFTQSLFDYLKTHGFTTSWLNRHGYYKKAKNA